MYLIKICCFVRACIHGMGSFVYVCVCVCGGGGGVGVCVGEGCLLACVYVFLCVYLDRGLCVCVGGGGV